MTAMLFATYCDQTSLWFGSLVRGSFTQNIPLLCRYYIYILFAGSLPLT